MNLSQPEDTVTHRVFSFSAKYRVKDKGLLLLLPPESF
jgi:hypothetical protein